jgi:RNA polymerase sigma-70 factor (ECF subfamily)
MTALLRAFHQAAATGAAAHTTIDTADLAGFLGALYARGRDAYPKLCVSEDAFGRCLARSMGDRPIQSLDSLAIEDLYLVCACLERARGAVDAFETAYAKVIRRAVSRIVPAGEDRADAEQRVRQHLLVGAAGGEPALAKYPGRAPLAKWIPVVAIRMAISLNRSETAERKLRHKAAAEAMEASPEDLLMRAELRSAIEPAVAEALDRLTKRDRLILRLYLVGGMSLSAIGVTLGLSQQAVSKRLANARKELLEDIRTDVARRLNITATELSSVMRFVASQLDVNVSRALGSR